MKKNVLFYSLGLLGLLTACNNLKSVEETEKREDTREWGDFNPDRDDARSDWSESWKSDTQTWQKEDDDNDDYRDSSRYSDGQLYGEGYDTSGQYQHNVKDEQKAKKPASGQGCPAAGGRASPDDPSTWMREKNK